MSIDNKHVSLLNVCQGMHMKRVSNQKDSLSQP